MFQNFLTYVGIGTAITVAVTLVALPAGLVIGLLLSLLMWPLRFGRRPARQHQRFRYFYGNRTVTAHVRGHQLDVRGIH